MNILIAPDSFKESLSALQVAQAIYEGFKEIINAKYILIPMADGGEGTIEVLYKALQATIYPVKVTNPLGKPITSSIAISANKQTAIIELSAAAGLNLLSIDQRNPLITTTYGVGQLIKAALDFPIKQIILGIGGSATNDAGLGLLQALGASFTDIHGQELLQGGQQLLNLNNIDLSDIDSRLQNVELLVACDVTNPLIGNNGASHVFAKQKGATPQMISTLEQALTNFSKIVFQQLQLDITTIVGGGAAGGVGAGLSILPQTKLRSGFDIINKYNNLEQHLKQADLVITGEGVIDSQSINGKVPSGIAHLAKKYNKPVIAIAGGLGTDFDLIYQHGVNACFPTILAIQPSEQVFANAYNNIRTTANSIARIINLTKGLSCN